MRSHTHRKVKDTVLAALGLLSLGLIAYAGTLDDPVLLVTFILPATILVLFCLLECR